MYAGIQVGAQTGDAKQSFNATPLVGEYDAQGVFGGFHLGFNHQTQGWIVGVETDLETSNVEGDFFTTTGVTAQGKTEVNWQGSVRGRLGKEFNQMLVYGTAGWAFGDVDVKGGPTAAPLTSGFSADLSGWTAGAGVEWAVGEDMFARFEYRYTDYNDVSGALLPNFGTVISTATLDNHAIRFGLTKKFDISN
jgi:outer membrane immunogenic protein